MKAGDTVVCVDIDRIVGRIESLTIGKHYVIIKTPKIDGELFPSRFIQTMSDDGTIEIYHQSRFKTLVEIREEKLKELGVL